MKSMDRKALAGAFPKIGGADQNRGASAFEDDVNPLDDDVDVELAENKGKREQGETLEER